jgi:hypothetical protein
MLGWPQTHDVEPQTASMNPAIGHAIAYPASTGSVAGQEIIDQRSRTAGTGPVVPFGVLAERSRPVVILVGHKVMMTLGPRIDHRRPSTYGHPGLTPISPVIVGLSGACAWRMLDPQLTVCDRGWGTYLATSCRGRALRSCLDAILSANFIHPAVRALTQGVQHWGERAGSG